MKNWVVVEEMTEEEKQIYAQYLFSQEVDEQEWNTTQKGCHSEPDNDNSPE